MQHAAAIRAGLVCLAGAALPPARASEKRVERVVPDLSALAGQPLTALPAPPPWVAVPPGNPWTPADVAAELKKITSKPPVLIYARPEFLRPDYGWLVAYVKWFRSLRRPLNMHYEDDVFDCDKFSRCFVAFANLLAEKAGEYRGSLCVGWATVFNDRSFGGVEAGGRHAIVIVGTSAGLIVVEPQTGILVPLRDYPNRDTLSAFYL